MMKEPSGLAMRRVAKALRKFNALATEPPWEWWWMRDDCGLHMEKANAKLMCIMRNNLPIILAALEHTATDEII